MTSDNHITDIVAQLGELRKLLLAVDQSGESASPILLKLAREKAEGVADAIGRLREPEFWEALNQELLADWPEDETLHEVEPCDELPAEEEEEADDCVEKVVEEWVSEPIQEPQLANDDLTDCVADEEEAQEAVTLDEVLKRRQAKELRKALNLNDRFRFCRELFGRDNNRMNETLALIDTMCSYEEAEDYIYNQLGWNAESPEVAEFMNVVEKHFL